MSNIMTASNQWMSRPDDERYLSLEELHQAVCARREISEHKGIALDHAFLSYDEQGEYGEIYISEKEGQPGARLNNWSFGQLCQRAKAPASYLRTLPNSLATVNLQYSLKTADKVDASMLVSDINGPQVRAVNSATYGRIWDAQVTGALLDRIDTNVWKVPAASYASSDPKRATTLYASDRDIFIFLVNEERPIEVPGDGADHLNRGTFIWNSEVGNASLGVATFLYEYVCDNRIVWGASEFSEIRIKHSSGAPHRFAQELVPHLGKYLDASAAKEEQTLQIAHTKEVGKDRKEVVEWLTKRNFTQKLAGEAYDQTEADGGNPRSVWGLVQGLTAKVRDDAHADTRVTVERQAGKLLAGVASTVTVA